jgi:hypothetical protein|tara:strand:- start:370 stop:528 length:159 start_codon:yes stop_codon:yes gene_type:complete
MEEEENLTDFELALMFIKQHVDNNPYAATKEQIDLLNHNQKIHEELKEKFKD